jgi:hypothetical protein
MEQQNRMKELQDKLIIKVPGIRINNGTSQKTENEHCEEKTLRKEKPEEKSKITKAETRQKEEPKLEIIPEEPYDDIVIEDIKEGRRDGA